MPICAKLKVLNPVGGEFLQHALVDTGNNFRSLISKEILDDNKITFTPANLSALSVDLKPVNIIGHVSLKFSFDGSDKIFEETFYIPETTSKIINLGYEFLKVNRINLLLDKFSFELPTGEQIPIENSTINIVEESKNIPLIPTNNVHTEQNSLIPGINWSNQGGTGTLKQNKTCVKLAKKTTFLPGGNTTVITIPIHQKNRKLYISPNNSKMTSHNGLMLMEGIYNVNEKGECWVNFVNLAGKNITLLDNVKVGYCFEFESDSPNSCNKSINQINELSGTTLLKRIKFIKEKLDLENSDLIKNNPGMKEKVVKLCLDHFDIFSVDDADIGNCDLLQYKIDLIPGAKPIKARNIQLNPLYEAKLKEQIENWLRGGVIEEGYSEWSSPIFAVKKKPTAGGEGKLRFVIDFRALNSVTRKINWPLPLISSNLEKLGTGNVFTTLDLTSAFHALAISKESKHLTAFTALNRQYLFKKLPFGLCNAPSVFCHLMDRVLTLIPGLYEFIISYLDDLIIFSKNVEEHLKHLRKLFGVLKIAKLKLNLAKCKFFTSECTYLGHIVSSQGLKMNPEYLEQIKNWSRPRTGKELQRFLGFSNYYRAYFPSYAKNSCTLDEHRNDKVIEWTNSLSKDWENFINMFSNSISKGYPQWDNPNPFIVDVDFSTSYFAGILSQNQGGEERIIGICSKKCNGAEKNYPSYKGELACLVFVLKTFLHYLRFRNFIVRTDSISLVHYKKWQKGTINGVTLRWIFFIQSFDFTVIHRKGRDHCNADNLSRGQFLCKEHKETDCEKCTSSFTLDPYEQDCPYQDQIFELHAASEVGVHNVWQSETQKDQVLSDIRRWIFEKKKLSSFERAELTGRKEVLFKLIEHLYVMEGLLIFRQPLSNGTFIERPVVPIGLYNKVFELAHNNSIGHKGVNETTRKINERFFLIGINKFVESRIKNCITCLRKIGQVPKHKQPITHSAISHEIFGQVSVDLIGPLTPNYFQGQHVRYIFILVDLFSRYIIAHPIKDATVESTVKVILEQVVPTYGLFRSLRSDRGTNFTGEVFKKVMDELGIETKLIPPRNPNSNPCERHNQSIYAGLRSDDRFESKDWARKLALTTFVINSSTSRRTGYTPYYLMFGRQPTLNLDFFSPILQKRQDIDCRSYLNYLKNLEEIIAQVSKKSKIYLEFQNKSRKASSPLFVNDVVFAFFNLVKIGVSKKLQSFYGGPFIVTKKFSEALFELSPFGSNPIKTNQVVSRDKIRKIDSKVELLGETLSFNVFPIEEIVPSEEITLGIDNTGQTEINDNKGMENDDFTYLDNDGDDFIEGNPETSQDLPQGEVDCDGGGDIMEKNSPFEPQPKDQEPPGADRSSGPHIHVENSFLEETVPSEASFFAQRPKQSSPEKVINVNKQSIVPKYILEEERKTRSQGGDNRIHVQIGLHNPIKRKK